MKKLAAALLVSSALPVTMATSALAAPPAAACNAGTRNAHQTVPHNTAGNMTAHGSIPHCDH